MWSYGPGGDFSRRGGLESGMQEQEEEEEVGPEVVLEDGRGGVLGFRPYHRGIAKKDFSKDVEKENDERKMSPGMFVSKFM